MMNEKLKELEKGGNLFSSDSEKKTESEDSDKTEKSKERKK